MKRIISFVCLLLAVLMIYSCSSANTDVIETEADSDSAGTDYSDSVIMDTNGNYVIQTNIDFINGYGNIILKTLPDSLSMFGYSYADIVVVKIGDQEIIVPIVDDYSMVDTDSPLMYAMQGTETERGYTILAVNMGNFAETYGIADIIPSDDAKGYDVQYRDGYDENTEVSIFMLFKQGYLEEFKTKHALATRTTDRNDYPELSDEEYANFRVVDTTGMGSYILYRSSSPLDPDLGRNTQADRALLDAGIVSVINTADTYEIMTSYESYSSSNYKKCNILNVMMSVDYRSDSFIKGFAEALRFIGTNEGPYLIHCKEGKDRTGFMCAVLECFMGATAEEVVGDYMLSYLNYFDIEKDDDTYNYIAKEYITKYLADAFGIDSIYTDDTDLSECAERYMKGLGLSDDEVEAVRNALSADSY